MAFIVKVPGINGPGKTEGCEKAGKKILESVNEIYSNESGVPINTQMFDLEEIHLDNSDLDLTHNLIFKNSSKIFEEKPRTIFLGGDHSISYPLTKSFFEHCKKEEKTPCLIVFDAHADCMEPKGEFPKNREWLRKLIEQGFPPQNIFLVGTRNLHPSEISFLEKNKIKRMRINPIIQDLDDSCDIVMEFSKGKEIYVSIDIGIVDPAFAPGKNPLEPGGLTSRQLLRFLQRLAKIKTIRAVDLVEINPDKDVRGMTVKLGAKILAELS